jgi:hypothetical protein
MAARRSAQPLHWVYLARVINIPAVQCHREAVTDDRTAQFLSEGCRPDTLDFQWFLDEPDLSFWEPVASAISPISLPMQQAWNAAFLAFLVFIDALAFGELIASGVNPNTGTRCEIDPVEWMRTGLILDVRNGDLIEVGQGKRTVRWSAITLRAAEPVGAAEPVRAAEPLRTATPEQKLGRIDWDDLWNEDVARREKGQLPNEKAYVRALETRIKERYGVTSVDGGDLRRFKAALYRGDLERPKRTRPKHKG